MAHAAYFSVTVTTPTGDLKNRVREQARAFVQKEKAARVAGAHKAQSTSSRQFRYVRPPNAAPRPGRSSTGGKLRTKIAWAPSAGKDMVELDVARLDREARHWIINEIGTGQRARMRRGGEAMPRGRTPKNATYLRTVKAQRGRAISANLAFGTGPGGRLVRPRPGARGQQLYPVSTLQGVSPYRMRARRIVIKREIQGKHFIQQGAEEGFREYERSVLAAARSTFAGRKRRP